MTQWTPLNTTADDCFEQLSVGVLVVKSAETPSEQEIMYCNPVFQQYVGGKWPEQGQTYCLKDVVSLSKGNPRKTSATSDLLDGFIQSAEAELVAEPMRVKLKASDFPGGLIIYFVHPYSEEQAISQAHSDFVSVVSHEFRTPLTSIKGFADTMLRYGGQLGQDQQTRFVSIIKDQADRLTRMVENLLTASKLGSEKAENAYRANDLKKMVDKVVENILAKASQDQTYANRTVNVSISDTLPQVWADQDKLEQVMTNLIDNAVKYSFPNSEVQVNAVAEDDKKSIRITVANQGIGIPKEHLPQIFTKFSRVDNPLTRQVEGTGLGLYITKSMITSMGGQITVSSEPDKETVFTVVLNAATAELQERYHDELVRQEAEKNKSSDNTSEDAE